MFTPIPTAFKICFPLRCLASVSRHLARTILSEGDSMKRSSPPFNQHAYIIYENLSVFNLSRVLKCDLSAVLGPS